MRKFPAIAVAFSLLTVPAYAQPTTIDETMSICTSVIADQYQAEEDPLPRWGECFGAVEQFVSYVQANTGKGDSVIAELVARLAELYRQDPYCKIRETELPIAISTAAAAVQDEVIKAEYVLIYEQMNSCDVGGTSSIGIIPASAN